MVLDREEWPRGGGVGRPASTQSRSWVAAKGGRWHQGPAGGAAKGAGPGGGRQHRGLAGRRPGATRWQWPGRRCKGRAVAARV
jgi:hypothetical protein